MNAPTLPPSKELVATFRKGDVVRWNALALHGADRDGWTVEGMAEKLGLFPVYRVRKGRETGHAVQCDLEPMPSSTHEPPVKLVKGICSICEKEFEGNPGDNACHPCWLGYEGMTAEELAGTPPPPPAAPNQFEDRARAWDAVARKLEEINPHTFEAHKTGLQCALAQIESMSISQPLPADRVALLEASILDLCRAMTDGDRGDWFESARKAIATVGKDRFNALALVTPNHYSGSTKTAVDPEMVPIDANGRPVETVAVLDSAMGLAIFSKDGIERRAAELRKPATKCGDPT